MPADFESNFDIFRTNCVVAATVRSTKVLTEGKYCLLSLDSDA